MPTRYEFHKKRMAKLKAQGLCVNSCGRLIYLTRSKWYCEQCLLKKMLRYRELGNRSYKSKRRKCIVCEQPRRTTCFTSTSDQSGIVCRRCTLFLRQQKDLNLLVQVHLENPTSSSPARLPCSFSL